MESLRKAVRSPIHNTFGRLSSKHRKLADRWADYEHRDKIRDGVIFHVKYLGSTLVSELEEEGQSYGDSISAEAIRTIVHMAKATHKTMTSLTVSPNGIRIVNMETQDVISDLDIHRICFCTADRVHEKVFAYIARNKENETMECHAFLCSKRKIAEDVTLTVAESFQIAKELNEVKLSEVTTTTTIPTSTSDDVRLQRNVLTASHVPTGTMITSSSTPVELTKSSAYDDNSRPLVEHDLMLFNSSKDLSRLPQF